MVQHTVEPFAATVVAVMNADEARLCVTQINSHMNGARVLLLKLYEGRGWAALGYASWRECVVNEFDASKTHLYRELEAAKIESRISPMGEIGALPERQLRPLAALTPMEQPIAWQEANERSDGKPTARVVEQVVREMRGDTPTIAQIADDMDDVLDPPMEPAQIADVVKPRINAGLFTSATPEWYTPNKVIERVEGVFGHIDLDPCSNSNDPTIANVPALHHWTQADNGLAQPWHGKVYMNPPYGDEIGAWVERLAEAYADGEILEGIALLPARTDTAWFQPLFHHHLCFVRGRLRFSGSENSAPFPSVVAYLGRDALLFCDWFASMGPIVAPAIGEPA